MHTAHFQQLMGSLDHREPPKAELWNIFEMELVRLKPSPRESLKVYAAFDISYDGHKNAPTRESGEAYIFHPVRAAIRAIQRQRTLEIKDVQLIVEILLHDCFEEAAKAGINPILMQSAVQIRLGTEVATDVAHLTKQKHRGQTNVEYLSQLLNSGRWRPIAAKLEDRFDNVLTIDSMSDEQQRAKITETAMWLPLLTQRLAHLLNKEVLARQVQAGFRLIPASLGHDIHRELRIQKSRLGMR